MITLREGYILTEQECVERGGHKYEETTILFLSDLRTRVCKYCGHKQRAYTPPTVWEDADKG